MSTTWETTKPRSASLLDRTSKTLLMRLRDWNDHASWERFSETYARMVYNLAFKSGLAREDAEEVVQITMVDVARRLREFEYDAQAGSFRGWLCMRARAGISERLRKNALNGRLFEARRGPEPEHRTGTAERWPDPAVDPEVLAERDWHAAVTELALDRVRKMVSPRQYQLFDLYAVKGWSARRIACALGVNFAEIYLAKARIFVLLKWEIKKVQFCLDQLPEGPLSIPAFSHSKTNNRTTTV